MLIDLGHDNVQIRRVDDGWRAAIAALIQRELDVIETAQLVLAVYENVGDRYDLQPGKRSATVSRWFREALGRSRGFSPRQIEHYLEVARAPLLLQKQARSSATLNEARKAMDLQTTKAQAPARLASRQEEKSMAHAVPTFAVLVEQLTGILAGDPALDDEQRELLRMLRAVIGSIIENDP